MRGAFERLSDPSYFRGDDVIILTETFLSEPYLYSAPSQLVVQGSEDHLVE